MSIIDNYKDIFIKLYGKDEEVFKSQYNRYGKMLKMYREHFDESEQFFFSTPGRTEIGGNHTDHNLGRVIAASINLDSIAIASKNNSSIITFISDSYEKPFIISVDELDSVKDERGTTNSLIRGIAARFSELGYKIGGFNAVITSDVLPGSGVSSSASIEVLIGSILNSLFNEGKISNEELAIIGRYAENHYFGKPCGLMDQMACAVGGIITIDFKDPKSPTVEKINFDFESHSYKMIVVDTCSDHADLTEDYSSIPTEMKSVAGLFGTEVCRELDFDSFLNKIDENRKKVGDRALLRAFHFIEENERVLKQVESLRNNNIAEFLKLAADSGNSSFKWLQNVFTTKNVKEQGLTLALAITEKFISEKGKGACRVHGGGFAGTILVFIPIMHVNEYVEYVGKVFKEWKVLTLDIRSLGAICLNDFIET